MSIKRISSSCLAIAMLTACGGSSNDSDSASDVLTGIFLDSPVVGISFATETQTGTTNDDGEFSYIEGESVTFSIGSLLFPSVPTAAVVTPADMSADGNISDNVVVNAATLLQSLDQDADLDNGIQIPDGAAEIATPIDLSISPEALSQDANVINLVANSGSENVQLLDSAGATEHLQASIDDIGFEQITEGTIDVVFDKQLFLFNGEIQTENFIIVRSGGTFDGTWNDASIAGTWEMREGYWCRVLTEFFNTDSLGSEDCQLWELNDNRIRGTRDRGTGNSFIYNIVG